MFALRNLCRCRCCHFSASAAVANNPILRRRRHSRCRQANPSSRIYRHCWRCCFLSPPPSRKNPSLHHRRYCRLVAAVAATIIVAKISLRRRRCFRPYASADTSVAFDPSSCRRCFWRCCIVAAVAPVYPSSRCFQYKPNSHLRRCCRRRCRLVSTAVLLQAKLAPPLSLPYCWFRICLPLPPISLCCTAMLSVPFCLRHHYRLTAASVDKINSCLCRLAAAPATKSFFYSSS